jgi:alkanesulfonate monooxygenase SsuD/methylene tetrahydromethanopterin reductase-like flavin-dependent oxidoreductase (luciferase family)
MAATFDFMSNGRLEFGFGAGWKKDEYEAYGIPFPSTRVRIAQMKEAVTIIKKMWTEDHPTFQGKYYHINDALCNPKPIQQPHPPIWIGGTGERFLLRAVAEQADGWNIYCRDAGGLKECEHKLAVLKKHCYALGRDPEEIEKSWYGDLVIAKTTNQVRKKLKKLTSNIWTWVLAEDGAWKPRRISTEEYMRRSIVGTPEECAEKIHKFSELGFTYFILGQISVRKEERELFADEVMSNISC